MNLPTEEDVLAELLLLWLEGQGLTHDVPDEMRWTPMAVGWAAWDRIQPNPSVPTIEAAIADSERRLECERLEREIIDTVLAWNEGEFSGSAEGRLILWAEALQSARLRALEDK